MLGANRILIALAAPAQRARLVAAIFIVNFLGLSVPVVIAGVATAHFGLHLTALAYCVATTALVAVAAGGVVLRGHRPTAGHQQHPGPGYQLGAPGPAGDSPRPVRKPPGLPRARVRAAGAAW